MIFWEILKDLYYGEIKEGDRFSSDAGIFYVGYDDMLYWEDTEEVVASGYDDLNWTKI